MYCEATKVSYNDKFNFPNNIRNIFHSVNPLYISKLIFHNFLYRPHGILINTPLGLTSFLQKHNFSPGSNSFRSNQISPCSVKPSLIVPANHNPLSWVSLIFIIWTSHLMIITLTSILLNTILCPLMIRPMSHSIPCKAKDTETVH